MANLLRWDLTREQYEKLAKDGSLDISKSFSVEPGEGSYGRLVCDLIHKRVQFNNFPGTAMISNLEIESAYADDINARDIDECTRFDLFVTLIFEDMRSQDFLLESYQLKEIVAQHGKTVSELQNLSSLMAVTTTSNDINLLLGADAVFMTRFIDLRPTPSGLSLEDSMNYRNIRPLVGAVLIREFRDHIESLFLIEDRQHEAISDYIVESLYRRAIHFATPYLERNKELIVISPGSNFKQDQFETARQRFEPKRFEGLISYEVLPL